MMKWLRKHTKQIMVVVVLLAMFSFVGAQGLRAVLAPNPADQTVMRAFGRDIPQGALMLANQDTETLNYLQVNWKPQAAGPDFDLKHWYLLAEEANLSGVEASEVAISQFMKSADEQLAQYGGIDYLRQKYNVGPAQIRHAIRREMMIQTNANRVAESALPSEPQVREYIRDTHEKVTVKMAVFDAANFVTDDMKVTDAELQAQFDTYRDVLPGEGDEGFGYKYPRRVTLQYVVLEPRAIQSQIKIDLKDVKDQWKADPSKYFKMVDAPGTPDPTTTKPAKPKKVRKQMLFSEARPQIEGQLRTARAKRIARQMANEIHDEMAKPWAGTERSEETGYMPIPTDAVKAPDYMKDIVDSVAKEFGIQPKYGQLTLATEKEIETNPDLKGASLQGVNEMAPPVDITEMAFRVPEFFKPDSAESSEVRLQYFQVPPAPLRVERQSYTFKNGQIAPIKELQKYVVFRVTEARESQPPASLDEIRDQVVQDVKESKAYEQMAPVSREFGAASQILGTETALTLFDNLRKDHGIRTIATPPAFARMEQRRLLPEEIEAGEPIVLPTKLQGVGRSKKLIDACFAMAGDDWKEPMIEAPLSSQKIAKANAMTAASPAPKVQVVDLPKLRRRVVVEYVSDDPVDRNEYETELRRQGYIDLARARPALFEWYDAKNIEKRCGYVNLRAEPKDLKSGIGSKASEDESEPKENT